jgi:neutral ceramidase
MRAGVAFCDITPGVGEVIPGQWLARYAERVRDPLRVTALAVENDGVRAVIVSCDCCFLSGDLVARVRPRLRDRLCIPPERAFLHATHTHTGPPIGEGLGSPCDPEWVARVAEAIVVASEGAVEALEECELAWSTATAPGLAFPRRYWMDDGAVRMHPAGDDPTLLRPDGVPDETLTALGVFRPGARLPHVVLANFACHPIVVGGALFYSGDYPGAVCRTLRAMLGEGAQALFINGFCADVGPDDVDSPVSGYGEEAMERMGVALAARAALGLLDAPRTSEAPIEGCIERVSIAIRTPAPEALSEARATLGDDLTVIPQDGELIVRRELLLVAREIAVSPTVNAEVIRLRLGDGLLIGWPGEVFSAYARRLRRLSPTPHLVLGCLVNDLHGYIPTREAFAGGGYETWLCRSSKVEEAAGDKLLALTREMLRG